MQGESGLRWLVSSAPAAVTKLTDGDLCRRHLLFHVLEVRSPRSRWQDWFPGGFSLTADSIFLLCPHVAALLRISILIFLSYRDTGWVWLPTLLT
jgi:hypothetical protein